MNKYRPRVSEYIGSVEKCVEKPSAIRVLRVYTVFHVDGASVREIRQVSSARP